MIQDADVPIPEVALGLSLQRSLEIFLLLPSRPTVQSCMEALGTYRFEWSDQIGECVIERVHLGNEFCERLLPRKDELCRAVDDLARKSVALTLNTPMVTDDGLRRLQRLLAYLPDGTEVVINDWGILDCLVQDHPTLRPVLGRQLNKMVKDPRLPSIEWSRLHPHDARAGHFQRLLGRFGIDQVEMDVPPYAGLDQFDSEPMLLGVHIPYGYAVKGRMCRIGSLSQKPGERFAAGHGCQRECLTYWVETHREADRTGADLSSFQRGNTHFYRHDQAMHDMVWQAIQKRRISRLIVAGDWHENRRTVESA